MEERYKTLVPFRAFFEVGVSPSEAAGRRKVVRTVPRLEAMNVPTGSFVMPSGYGLMVRRPDEELARAMLRCPPPPEPTAGSFTPRGAILYSRLMARGGHAGYVRRSDDDRLREMALSGILVALPPPDPKADLVGYDFVPAMRMASRILPEGRGGVYEIEPSHELTRFREDLEELTASLDALGADRVAFEDIGCEDVIRMRADFTYGYVVVASRPESYETWVEGPLPGHAGLEELLGGLVRRGEMPREDFLEEVRIGLGGGPGLGA